MAFLVPFRLVAPLQEMHHYEFEPVAEFAFVATPHALDLLRQVSQVQLVYFAPAQQRRLLLRPGIKVLLVEISVGRHASSCFLWIYNPNCSATAVIAWMVKAMWSSSARPRSAMPR